MTCQSQQQHKPGPREINALIEALKRHGYTNVPPNNPYGGNGFMAYYEELHIQPTESKPYWTYIDKGVITILHKTCHQCTNMNYREHDEHFLKEMIRIIGKLDAHAEYDDGHGINGPWLHIIL